MIISANQPYFAPYPGFFQKILLSDIFVILDQVQFPLKTTWVSRNRFKNDQGYLWLTIPVWKKGLGLQLINEVKICKEGGWEKKHLDSLKSSYDKAPFFADHQMFFEDLYTNMPDRLIDFNLAIIFYLLRVLNIKTQIIYLSDYKLDSRKDQLLVDLCRKTGANNFLAQIQARKYLQPRLFQDNGIQLQFFRPKKLIYPQLWGKFLPNLSTFDLLFNCGPKTKEFITS